MIVRAPSDAALAAEGWELIESDHEDGPAPEFWWMHPPSKRTVKVEEASARLTVVDDANRHHNSGWFVFVREHDELGNPIDYELVGPLETMAHAMRFARAIRRSILEDRKVDLRSPEQLELLSTGLLAGGGER